MQYLPLWILANQLAILAIGLIGTVLICTIGMTFISGHFSNPLKHAAVWTAIVFTFFESCAFLGGDMEIADRNQQAYLVDNGTTTDAQIVAVKETILGRNLNARYIWHEYTCEFTDDDDGNAQRGTTTEGYNKLGLRGHKPPWDPGGELSTGSTVQITYLPGNCREFRLSKNIRKSLNPGQDNAETTMALCMSWFVTIAWLIVWFVGFLRFGPETRRWRQAFDSAEKDFSQGRYEQAIAGYQTSLSTARSIKERKSGQYLLASYGLAKSYRQLGKVAKSEEYYKQVLAIEHLQLMSEFNGSAKEYHDLLKEQGRVEEATTIAEKFKLKEKK